MDVSSILASLDKQIADLQKAKDTLTALTKDAPPRSLAEPSKAAGKKVKVQRKMTPEGRARIAAAQKARWAKKNTAHHEEIVVAEEESIPA